jgi:hypothetical protein
MPPEVQSRVTDADVDLSDLDTYLDTTLGTVEDFDGSDEAPPPRSKPRRRDAAEDDEDTADDDYEDVETEAEEDEEEDEDYSGEYDDDEEESDEESEDADDFDDDEYAQIRRERDEALAEKARIEREQQRAKEIADAEAEEARWADTRHKGMAHYDGIEQDLDRREEHLLANYHRANNPQDALARGMRQIRMERKQAAIGRARWLADHKDAYYAKQNEYATDMAIRMTVAELTNDYQLTTAEQTRLKRFAKRNPDPEEFGIEFKALLADREAAKEYAKRAGRKAVRDKARDMAANTPRLGRGQARQKKVDGIDDYIDRAVPSKGRQTRAPRERLPAQPQGGNLPW